MAAIRAGTQPRPGVVFRLTLWAPIAPLETNEPPHPHVGACLRLERSHEHHHAALRIRFLCTGGPKIASGRSTLGLVTLLAKLATVPELEPAVLRKPVPGRLFAWVKLVSWVEAAVFAALLVVWLLPGQEQATFVLGLTHGLGYIGLCLLILVATVRREAPWPLLAASLTPAGPFGTVIGIELIERRGWGVAPRTVKG